LSRWDNEGGAGAHHGGVGAIADASVIDDPVLTNAELVQLRIRVIALENVIIAVLAKVSDRQLDLILEMADHIAPRPEATQHPLTIQAAAQMNHLVNRAGHFRD
jgi:hypothetical protein